MGQPHETGHMARKKVDEWEVSGFGIVEDDKLLGIISIGDLVKSIVEEKQAEIDQLNQYIAGSY